MKIAHFIILFSVLCLVAVVAAVAWYTVVALLVLRVLEHLARF